MSTPRGLQSTLESTVAPLPPTPITCLGHTFADDDARRTFFTEQLRAHLHDPAFRAIEGFPLGEDEDILALSDPPYYTACPNPFLPAILAEWQAQRATLHATLGLDDASYHREPFAADVSEGKNDPIYNAHSYHTKVPHKAIMRYILHYTEPGDVVFDGFCGTGMTGVAAQLCGDRKAVEGLGYQVEADGAIFEGETRISRLGARKAVLNDLSPAATFIAYNYNTPVDVQVFEREAKRILQEVEDECGWMYETWHPHCDDPNRVKASVKFFVWSFIFHCPSCDHEFAFADLFMDEDEESVRNEVSCPSCATNLKRRNLDFATEYVVDPVTGKSRKALKRTIISVHYTLGGQSYEKALDQNDIGVQESARNLLDATSYPHYRMLFRDGTWGDQWREGYHQDVSRVDHFYEARPLIVLAKLYEAANSLGNSAIIHWLQSFSVTLGSRLCRYNMGKRGNGPRSGTLYIASLVTENNLFRSAENKLDDIVRAMSGITTVGRNANISTHSTSSLSKCPSDTVDYVFTDPPFGGNLMYSELNFLWESWIQVFTNQSEEAIISRTQHKAILDYQRLMVRCMAEYRRILRPGSWITVEFHNSQNSVWNTIQEVLGRSGLVVCDVRAFSKMQGSFNQVTTSASPKQDLIISAYKPTAEFERSFQLQAGTESAAWEFVRQHLRQLPAVVRKGPQLESVAERQNFLLFDRMVAYHVQRGIAVPLSAAQFYTGLKQRFVERDSMYFLPEQVADYDAARLAAESIEQISLFVNDEKSAVTWLRVQLAAAHATFQEIQPRFLTELHQARHEALPDLRVLLEQNFLRDDADRWYVPDPSKAEDLEKLRLRDLLHEFDGYAGGRKKLTTFRTEAVRAGFARAWAQHDYKRIVQIAERLPEAVLQEDPELLMYYDNASPRTG